MSKIGRLNPIIEALKSSPKKIHKISIQNQSGRSKLDDIARLAREKGVPFVYVPKKHLDRIDPTHQGAIARLSLKPFASLSTILEQKKNLFLVLLDEISDPQNLGAVIRTAEAGGVDGIILPERRTAGLTEAVLRVSAGAVEYLPIVRVKNLARTMDELREKGVWLIGAEGGGEDLWYDFDYTSSVGLVFGSEGRGIRPLIRQKCDRVLSLPLCGRLNSLNVASAASIFIYEVVRQRNKNHE